MLVLLTGQAQAQGQGQGMVHTPGTAPTTKPSTPSVAQGRDQAHAARTAGEEGAVVAPAGGSGRPVVFFPPMGLPGLHTLEDGKPVGLYPELIAAVAKAAKVSPQIRSTPWPEPVEAVRDGRGDVLGPVMGQPSSFADLVHTVPLMRVEWARYVRTGDARSTQGIVFAGVRVAVLNDSFGTRWLAREHPAAVQVPVASIEDGLEALANQEADALLTLKLPTRHLVARAYQGRIEEVGTELTAPMTLGVSPAAQALVPALNAGIEALTASGEIERLRSRWMPEAPRTASEIGQARLSNVMAALVALLLVLLVFLLVANRRLARARRVADEARHAKSEFLAVMSHEIRTPINGLVNLIDLLQRSGTSTEQAELLRKAEQANQSLLGLVNQVLDFSKIEASRMEIVPHRMALDALWCRVQAVLSAQQRAAEVDLQFESLPSGVPTLWADEQRLAQVLINLGGNALKFTQRGMVRLAVQVLLPARDEQGGTRLRFEVRDTGPGITADQMDRLFQPFVQLKSGLDRPHAGTGLGLSTSEQLVRQMGGELKVDSRPGELTRFWFDLSLQEAPAVHDTAQPDGPAQAAAPKAPVPATGRTVMVVDDNPLNLLVTRKILEQEGFTVWQADRADSALAMLEAPQAVMPEVILMDLHMPGLDGIEAVRRLRAMLGSRLPPVLAVTGAVTDDAREAAFTAGMVGFVPKPFERRTLLAAIEERRQASVQKP